MNITLSAADATILTAALSNLYHGDKSSYAELAAGEFARAISLVMQKRAGGTAVGVTWSPVGGAIPADCETTDGTLAADPSAAKILYLLCTAALDKIRAAAVPDWQAESRAESISTMSRIVQRL